MALLVKDPKQQEFFQSLDPALRQRLLTEAKDVRAQTFVLESMMDPTLERMNLAMKPASRAKLNDLPLEKKYLLLKKYQLRSGPSSSSSSSSSSPAAAAAEVAAATSQQEEATEENAEDGDDEEQDLPDALEEEEMSERQMQQVQQEKQQQFNRLCEQFYQLITVPRAVPQRGVVQQELEVRFGTLSRNRRLNRMDYDNVVQRLLNLDFQADRDEGKTFLRIYHEHLNPSHGQFEQSNVRVELAGPSVIEEYCRTNQLMELYQQNRANVRFLRKHAADSPDGSSRLQHVDVPDFNFRLCCQTERSVSESERNRILTDWANVKKEFRYINRVSFTHRNYPVKVELSIVQHGKRNKATGDIYRDFVIGETPAHLSVFDCPQNFELEIEVMNQKIGPGTVYRTGQEVANMLRQVIKMVLSGLQRTNYPVGHFVQQQVLRGYMRMLWEDDSAEMLGRPVTSKCFLGPNSVTLQVVNITEEDPEAEVPNIRKDFVVTDKADGERCLLYIQERTGKVFLLDNNMHVMFTGTELHEGKNEWGGTLLDGEFIKHDKARSTLLHRFAAFDIYYRQRKDVRAHPFYPLSHQRKPDHVPERKARYELLREVVAMLQQQLRSVETVRPGLEHTKVPLRVVCKSFYPPPMIVGQEDDMSIFDACRTVLQAQVAADYAQDGLIFTPKYLGVGSTTVGKAGPKFRTSWEHSLKWKPPQFNSNDFLVTTVKDEQGQDVVRNMFDAGLDLTSVDQHSCFKTLELRCGFCPARDGVLNAMDRVLQGDFARPVAGAGERDYFPQIFFPTEPYQPRAGFCHVKLAKDRTGQWQMMTEEGDVFRDNMVVEFRLDRSMAHVTPVEWQWKPIRVRHDKTSKMLRGEKEFGNSYRVCNENWKSMHFPVLQSWLEGEAEPPSFAVSTDKYYNTPAGELLTTHMKCFHNLFVKRKLLQAVCAPQGTLVDLACGKAGDLMKWVGCRLSFVLGLDLSQDNVENQLDGACTRYVKAKMRNRHITDMLFAVANSAYNIRSGEAGQNDSSNQIIAAVFGQEHMVKREDLPPGVRPHFGVGHRGFQVCSCQFALHYFFESPDTLRGFLRNVNQCTALNGYFVGTAFDGKLVFQALRGLKAGESIELHEDGKKIWQCVKGYGGDEFPDSAASIGFRIDVFQESINQLISEYLVHFDYLDRLMVAYGFRPLTPEEARAIGLPKSSGLFAELYEDMMYRLEHELVPANEFGAAAHMTEQEKKISFLNRYFVYKKVNDVNADNVKLDLTAYADTAAARDVLVQKEEEHVEKMVQELVEREGPAPVKRLSARVELAPDADFVLVADDHAVSGPPPAKKARKKAEPKAEKADAKPKAEKAEPKPRKPRAKKGGEPPQQA